MELRLTSRLVRDPAPPQPLEPDALRELRQRCALATPEDTARGMFFRGVLETVRRVGGSAMEQLCRQSLPEKRYIDFFSYPITQFLPLAFQAAGLLSEHCGGLAAAHRVMGQKAAHDFLESVAGRTLLMLAYDEPRLLLGQLPTGFLAAVSYGERSMVWTGPRSGRFVMKRDFMPTAYHEGVLHAVLEAVGARDIGVQGRELGLLDTEYALSWR
ncbi:MULTISPECIES: DUF2378 family protein [Myxococcus]|uniref:Myxococcales-restricted protein, TIGR02265 family n=1 Tax=Myxococcus virescens TaxID=83456 RepID=A0A511HHS7_9BACT|nr:MULTISPECIES: DUF2378 family protein [Myxococcus]WNZ61804.1 DUF2378 family protein [Myxococcus sp. MxC21-1]GEL73120.1 hypothetical protein MVI01_49040 [Myxococcus virescens]SDD62368.1 Myxococcales-restricted protein, TIGR02265 family [Myxococcus virescens]